MNPITNDAASSNIGGSNYSGLNGPVSRVIPVTTGKVYGNFLNANQLDEMIKALKSTSNSMSI